MPRDSGLVARAAAMLRAAVPDTGPGVTVLIARGDRVLYRGARGRADVELAVPLAPADVFRIGSVTKPFTAATVLSLVADGRIRLDDPLSRFLPQYPGGGAISIAQLLDHTAGVSDAWDAGPAEQLDTRQLVARIGAHAPDFPPGTGWSYSNSGYILLGAVVEAVTGTPWHVAIADRLLRPLGLAHTGYHGDAQLVYGRALGYSVNDSGETIRAPYVSMTGPAAAGALSSTVDDLFRFIRALATGRVLPPHLYTLMTTPKATASGRPVNYGFGVMVGAVRGERVVEHNGGIEGFTSQLTYFPAESVTVVVLSNSDAGPTSPRSLAHRLGALAIGRPYRPLRAVGVDAVTLRRIAGVYRIDSVSTHTLIVRGGKLFVQRTGGPARPLAVSAEGLLFYPDDEIDYYRVVRDPVGGVVALEYHGDGPGLPRREERLPAARVR